MQEIVANVYNVTFDLEIALQQQLGAQPLPFPGMDKSGAAVCTFYLKSACNRGTACPFRHVRGDKEVVCKHWLRGLCKKGDDCEFLHEYDMSKMPECFFYSKFGSCSNKECPFLHIDPEAKMKDCAWYDRGFCRHGPNCKNRHVRRVLCVNYLNGFCLDGSNCKYQHPTFDLPQPDMAAKVKNANIVCHNCNEIGHKIMQCPRLQGQARAQFAADAPNGTVISVAGVDKQQQQPQQPQQQQFHQQGPPPGGYQPKRPINEVVCFKCGEKGHYANKCPKGHLAFLSLHAPVGPLDAPPPRQNAPFRPMNPPNRMR